MRVAGVDDLSEPLEVHIFLQSIPNTSSKMITAMGTYCSCTNSVHLMGQFKANYNSCRKTVSL